MSCVVTLSKGINYVKVSITPFRCSTCPIQVGAVMVAKALHYFNSVLNPIIYGLMNKQFKTAFRHLFTSTYSSVTGKAQPVTRSDIERQLSSIKSWGLTSLKIRSSTQDKGNAATTELCNYLEKSTGTSLWNFYPKVHVYLYLLEYFWVESV